MYSSEILGENVLSLQKENLSVYYCIYGTKTREIFVKIRDEIRDKNYQNSEKNKGCL